MSLWSSIKAAMRWSAWGGQAHVLGGLGDWASWHGTFPGTGYDYAAAAGNLYQNPTVMACLSWYQRAFPEAALQVAKRDSTGEENVVANHPLVAFLQRPNPFHTGDMLWQATLWDWLLYGNAYWLKERNTAGDVIRIWNIPQYRIKPQWPPDGKTFIGSYLMQVDGNPQVIPVTDVVHFRCGRDPQNERLGWAPLLAGLREVAALNEGANYRGALLRNTGVPSHLLSPKPGSPPFDQDQRKALIAWWESKFCSDKRGSAAAASLPMDAVRVGFSPAELDLGPMLNADADTVCSLLGLSSMVVGISAGTEHKTYANYSEAERAAYRHGLKPLHGNMASALDLQLLADFGDPETECVRWCYDEVDIMQEDDNDKWSRIDEAVKTGNLARNEARALMDQPPIDDESYDLPQPLTQAGFQWDNPPAFFKPPEPPPPSLPLLPPGALPESSGDQQANAPQPAQRQPQMNGQQAKALPPVAVVRITQEDVTQATDLWNELMPEEFGGLLEAAPTNGKR